MIYFLLQQEIQSLREKLRKQKSSTDVVAAEQVRTRNVLVTEKVWSVICSPQDMLSLSCILDITSRGRIEQRMEGEM